ncbi:MAG: transglycosylase domain-containing protein, partial [Pseudomonadota bacterium]
MSGNNRSADAGGNDRFSAENRFSGAPEKASGGSTGISASLVALRTLQGVSFLASLSIIGLVGALAFSGLYLNRLSQDLPDYKVLADYEPSITTRVYAGDGTFVAEFASERRIFVPIDAIPKRVSQAFVSAEDKNFYTHNGLDARGILRAQLANVSNILNGRRLEGGSTITQQVAKNFLLTNEVSYERKIKEAILANRMERAMTKDRLLELYLNEIYL